MFVCWGAAGGEGEEGGRERGGRRGYRNSAGVILAVVCECVFKTQQTSKVHSICLTKVTLINHTTFYHLRCSHTTNETWSCEP